MRSELAPLVLNGSYGEGGAASFRTALTMSAFTERSVRIHSIRGAKRKPGLWPEDLTFARMLGHSCGAKLIGDDLGSNELTFSPKHWPRALHAKFDIAEHEQGTVPGNALVILESLLPVLARTGKYSKVTLLGETHNLNTLSFDAWERGSLVAHRRQGIYVYPQLVAAGYGFGGRGEVVAEIEPSMPNGVDWRTRGELQHLTVVLTTSELADSVAARGVQAAEDLMRDYRSVLSVESQPVRSRSPGAFVTIIAEFERGFGSSTAMGARGVRMESVVEQAWAGLQSWMASEATVDPYLADQLVIPALLATGPTTFKTSQITSRLLTQAWIIKQFMPIHLTILGQEGGPGVVSIEPG